MQTETWIRTTTTMPKMGSTMISMAMMDIMTPRDIKKAIHRNQSTTLPPSTRTKKACLKRNEFDRQKLAYSHHNHPALLGLHHRRRREPVYPLQHPFYLKTTTQIHPTSLQNLRRRPTRHRHSPLLQQHLPAQGLRHQYSVMPLMMKLGPQRPAHLSRLTQTNVSHLLQRRLTGVRQMASSFSRLFQQPRPCRLRTIPLRPHLMSSRQMTSKNCNEEG